MSQIMGNTPPPKYSYTAAANTVANSFYGIGQSQMIPIPGPVAVPIVKEYIMQIFFLDGTIESFKWKENRDVWTDSFIGIYEGENYLYIPAQSVKKIIKLPLESKDLPDFEPDTSIIKKGVKKDESRDIEA